MNRCTKALNESLQMREKIPKYHDTSVFGALN